MRHIGTSAAGVRLPIINPGDNLAEIVVDCVKNACAENNTAVKSSDVIGITESIVARMQNNYASLPHIGADVRNKFGGGSVGVVFPILSRNRFLNILKGIAMGAEKVYVLLSFPSDEVGNPIMDEEIIDEINDKMRGRGAVRGAEFKEMTSGYKHPFTGVNYISLYEEAADNIEVFVSNDPRDILKLTKNAIAADIHRRNRTKSRLLKAGAEKVYTLSDILSSPVTFNGEVSGFNPDYGVLGSNMASHGRLKLFPKDCEKFVADVQHAFSERLGTMPEVLVYGDGAFKDPAYGIWELADPVVSPGYTKRLEGQPTEIKFKLIADEKFTEADKESQRKAVTDAIQNKTSNMEFESEGTTPRKYADLIGSLCDLMGGSGDKGTPVIMVSGYFDDYTSK